MSRKATAAKIASCIIAAAYRVALQDLAEAHRSLGLLRRVVDMVWVPFLRLATERRLWRRVQTGKCAQLGKGSHACQSPSLQTIRILLDDPAAAGMVCAVF